MIRWLSVGVVVVLSGCSSVHEWMAASAKELHSDSAAVEMIVLATPDGPPLINSIEVSSIPEPEAKPEPLSDYGNPENYKVDGVVYELTPVAPGFSEIGTASWYGRKFHGELTSSGEVFDMFQFTAAHKTMPIPAWIRVTNLKNNLSLVIRVNDRGPFKEDRVLDLSWAAAERLKFSHRGTAPVSYEVLSSPTSDTTLIPNPLSKPAQVIFQVIAVSTEVRAMKIINQLRQVFKSGDAVVRIEPNGNGLYRIQVLPKADVVVERAIFNQLVSLGWSPQRQVANNNQVK